MTAFLLLLFQDFNDFSLPARPAVKPSQMQPVNPSKPGPRSPELVPKIEAKKAETAYPYIGITFDTWPDAEIWLARPLSLCEPGASQAGLPRHYLDCGWYSLGKVTSWRTENRLRGGTEFYFAATSGDKWSGPVLVRQFPGARVTVRLK